MAKAGAKTRSSNRSGASHYDLDFSLHVRKSKGGSRAKSSAKAKGTR